MSETKIKKQILVFMLAAKLLTIMWIGFNYFTIHALEGSEALSALTIVLPLFTVYLTAIVKDAVKDPYIADKDNEKNKNKVRKIKPAFRTLTYIIFPVYFFAVVWVIYKTATGDFDTKAMQSAIGIVESAFGVYIGQIVFALFKKED